MRSESQYLGYAKIRQINEDLDSYDYEEQQHATFHFMSSPEQDVLFLDGIAIGKSLLDNLICTAVPDVEAAAEPQDEDEEEKEREVEERWLKGRRPTSSILYPQIESNKRSECMRGPRSQTQNMGKHLKSVTAAFLKVLVNARILTAQESVSASIFNKSNGGHSDFHQLFRSRRLSAKCLEYFSSKDFVTSIMRSPKMTMRNKLIMVRHLEVLRSVSYKQLTSWKMQI